MTIVESLQRILEIAERKHGPNAPGVKDLRRQLEEMTSGKQTRTGSDEIVSWNFGLRGKSKSESPDTKSSSAAKESRPSQRRRSRPAQLWRQCNYKMKQNPLDLLTEGERHWFGQWLTESQVLQGIKKASKYPNPNKKFVVLQVLEAARIRAEKGLPPYGDRLEKHFESGKLPSLKRSDRRQG